MADYNFLLETRLGQDQQLTLQMVERVSRAAGLNLYLTGGAMRDLVAGQPVRSLEITTEGDPTRLAAALRQEGAERVSLQPEQRGLRFHYRGVRVRLGAAQTAGGEATIIEDLRHRGLTLNSIGLSLNPGSRGLPLDPTNGIGDIEARLIRMSDAYVFYENPIVILRAIRLQVRLQFELEERTAARMTAAREGNYLERATNAVRGQELEAIVYQPEAAAILKALEAGGWLEAAFGKGVQTAKMQLGVLARLPETLAAWQNLGLIVDPGLTALPVLLSKLGPAEQTRLTRWLPSAHLSEWKKVVSEAKAFEARWIKAVAGERDWLMRAQEVIEKTVPEAVVYAVLEPSNAKAAKKLKDFQAAAQQARARIPTLVLRGLGVTPGSLAGEAIIRPLYRRLLAAEALTEAEIAEALRTAVATTIAPARPAAERPRKAALKPAPKPARPAPPKAAAKPALKPAAKPAAKAAPRRTRTAAAPAPKRGLKARPAAARKRR